MGKARKSDTVSKAVAEVAAVNVVPSSTKEKSSKSVAKAKVTTAVKVETPDVEPGQEKVTESTDTSDSLLAVSFTQFLSKLQTLATQMNALKTEFRTLEKRASRELKAAAKATAKRKRKSGNRAPSGFVKPTLISDELAKFLSKPTGTEMARTEVTREINGYIRANSLQDKTNGRKINPDQQLATLLKIHNGDELTYFNLQRYMSPHFAKASKPLV